MKRGALPPTLKARAHSNTPVLLPTTVDRTTPSPAPPRGHGIRALSPAVWHPTPPVWCIAISVDVGGGPTGTAGEVPHPKSAVAPAELPEPLPRMLHTQPPRLRPWQTREVPKWLFFFL